MWRAYFSYRIQNIVKKLNSELSQKQKKIVSYSILLVSFTPVPYGVRVFCGNPEKIMATGHFPAGNSGMTKTPN